jgi:Flp pilus assembly protein TadD
MYSLPGHALLCFSSGTIAIGTELNQGTQAHREGNYEEAIGHFQKAVSLNPQNRVAHLYLATALAEQYIPGVNEAENLQTGQDALDEFQKVLDLDPKSLVSVKGIASLDLNMKRFAAATQFYVQAIELEPNNPELYYPMGIADWTQSDTDRLKLTLELGARPRQTVNGRCGMLGFSKQDSSPSQRWN